jgi:hypothetical protein
MCGLFSCSLENATAEPKSREDVHLDAEGRKSLL